jgi:hypothetical protein
MECIVCKKRLDGKSKKYCSNKCKQKFDRDSKSVKLKGISTSGSINDALSKQIEVLILENEKLRKENDELKNKNHVVSNSPIVTHKKMDYEKYTIEPLTFNANIGGDTESDLVALIKNTDMDYPSDVEVTLNRINNSNMNENIKKRLRLQLSSARF